MKKEILGFMPSTLMTLARSVAKFLIYNLKGKCNSVNEIIVQFLTL